MDVSIIIINYNTFNMTCDCIESIYKHTKDISFEIILVDNASKECSADLFLEKYPNIVLIKNDENWGFAKGNNIGIKKAKSDYVFLLNNDTYLIENSVFKLLNFVRAKQNVGAVSPKIIYPKGSVQFVAQRFPSIKFLIIQFFRLQKLISKEKRGEILLGSYFNQDKTIEVDWIWGTAFFFAKKHLKLLEEQQLYDKYFMYQEDMQWCYDFRKNSLKNYFFSETKIVHIGGGSQFSKKNEMSEENFNDFIRKIKGKAYLRIYKFIQRFLMI